jgi:hypothetical protein
MTTNPGRERSVGELMGGVAVQAARSPSADTASAHLAALENGPATARWRHHGATLLLATLGLALAIRYALQHRRDS